MTLLRKLLHDYCPSCKQPLITKKSNVFSAEVIKTCPKGHYKKEFHPAIETYIETTKSEIS
ncbi:hypothetical protein ACE1TI_08880 [Alteribacillus sp. JSM 102045]|uniref:hypothetical protein n=1 Tax=Alteribacillus sp. JSM 102045 TaxID=1562101 RepID=UPI0035BFF578